jgi:hypothetical protein
MGQEVGELELGNIVRAKDHVVHVPHYCGILILVLNSNGPIQNLNHFAPLHSLEWLLGIGCPTLAMDLLLPHQLDQIIDQCRLGRVSNRRMSLFIPWATCIGM